MFYVVEDFLGSDRFFEVWKSRNHPENRTPIYVIGKSYTWGIDSSGEDFKSEWVNHAAYLHQLAETTPTFCAAW